MDPLNTRQATAKKVYREGRTWESKSWWHPRLSVRSRSPDGNRRGDRSVGKPEGVTAGFRSISADYPQHRGGSREVTELLN
jgi:hypothetical protein